MKRIKTIVLGTECFDKATQLRGTLTHMWFNLAGYVEYLFQPHGLNEDQEPVRKIKVEAERLELPPNSFEEIEIPFEILGTTVTNKPSGFKGMATAFIRHINGCFHVEIQPAGLHPKKKTPVRSFDFDLRECTGDMITQLDAEKLKESKRRRPSPTGDRFDRYEEPARESWDR